MYFYHPDHLGSSSLITGSGGDVLQHIEYVPYGEVFLEEKNATWRTPYKFNAKELDEETGLYYYGARYYDPKTSVWISSDPLREKYPNATSYLYCNGNPVRYIDPDGKAWYMNKSTGELYYNKNLSKRVINYQKQKYEKVGDNQMMGDMGETKQKKYNYDESQKLAQEKGYSINPTQEVTNQHLTKYSDSDSPASSTSNSITVVNEKYDIFTKSESNKIEIKLEPLILKKSAWGVIGTIAKALAGAAEYDVTDRRYYKYVCNEEVKKGMKAAESPYSPGDVIKFYRSWDDYIKDTNNEGILLTVKKE